jgi:hypothetical protein
MRSTDHDELQRQAQAAQARNLSRRRQRKAEMKTSHWYTGRKHNWTRAFEMLGLQMMALVYVAIGMAIGFGIGLMWPF